MGERARRTLWFVNAVVVSAALGSTAAGLLILAGVEPLVGWLIGALISVGTFAALYWADRRAGVDGSRVKAAEARRNAQTILQPAAIAAALAALDGADDQTGLGKTIVVRPRRTRSLGLLAGVVCAAAAVGVEASIDGFAGVFLGVVVTTELVVFGRYLIPGRVLLELNDEGLNDRASIYKVGFVPWAAVGAARIVTNKRGKDRRLLVQLADPEFAPSRRGLVGRWFIRLPATNLTASEICIPDVGDVPLERLIVEISAHCASRPIETT